MRVITLYEIGDELLDRRGVGLVHIGRTPQLSFLLAIFCGQDMAGKSLLPLDLPRTCDRKSLRCTAMGLQLRHDTLSLRTL